MLIICIQPSIDLDLKQSFFRTYNTQTMGTRKCVIATETQTCCDVIGIIFRI